MIKLQLINAAIIYHTAFVTSRLFRKSFDCRYNPRMDYAFCLLTLKSSEKWRSPLFGATGNFKHQILPYGILFLTFINTNVFYLLSFKFSRNLFRPWPFPLRTNARQLNKLHHIFDTKHKVYSFNIHMFLYLYTNNAQKIQYKLLEEYVHLERQ
jgi:hypothetical protein